MLKIPTACHGKYGIPALSIPLGRKRPYNMRSPPSLTGYTTYRIHLINCRDGSYVLPVITHNVVGTYVTWIFRRNVPLFIVTVPPDTPQRQGGAPSQFKTPRHTQHTAHLQHTEDTAHSIQQTTS